jgi:hypothetical protein
MFEQGGRTLCDGPPGSHSVNQPITVDGLAAYACQTEATTQVPLTDGAASVLLMATDGAIECRLTHGATVADAVRLCEKAAARSTAF